MAKNYPPGPKMAKPTSPIIKWWLQAQLNKDVSTVETGNLPSSLSLTI